MGAELLPSPAALAWLVLLGGWVAVDGTSLGQLMVSRPIVAASLAGWLAGNAPAGAAVGMVLEAFHLAVLPVGAARYPESGPPAVVAAAIFAAGPHTRSALLVVVLFALGWEWVAGATVRFLRHANVRVLSLRPSARLETLEARHLGALGLDVARGVALVAVGLPLLAALLANTLPHWGLDESVADAVLGAAVVGLLGGTARLFGGRWRLFVAGAAVGALFLVLRA